MEIIVVNRKIYLLRLLLFQCLKLINPTYFWCSTILHLYSQLIILLFVIRIEHLFLTHYSMYLIVIFFRMIHHGRYVSTSILLRNDPIILCFILFDVTVLHPLKNVIYGRHRDFFPQTRNFSSILGAVEK